MLDNQKIMAMIFKQCGNNTTDIAAMVLMMKTLGYSPKKIKRELKKYRRVRNRIMDF